MPLAAEYRATGVWNTDTLAQNVSIHATEDPDRLAVVDLLGRRRITYGQLDADANRIANFLAECGVEAGEIVALQMPNWYETVAAAIGAYRAGAAINPMLPIYRQKELTYMMKLTEAKVIFTPEVYREFDYLPLMAGVQGTLSLPIRHVAVPDPSANPDTFREWLDGYSDRPLNRPIQASSVSEIVFTSGTEATPKAIMHTEENANSNMRSVWRSLGMSEDDIVWMPSPLGHSTGFNFGMRIALYFGLPLVLQDRWSAQDAITIIEQEKPTYSVAATTFISDVIRAPQATHRELSSLRLFGSGGAPVPPAIISGAADLGMNVIRLFGQTEVLVATWNPPSAPLVKRLQTDGPPVSDVNIEVRNDRGKVQVGYPGEVFVRGPANCRGLFLDPVRTRAKFTEGGWVRTGDLGVIDEDGYLTIVGRKTEIIIRGGLNIAPREIEEYILKLEGVAAVAVVGLPDQRLGEIACACVVLNPGVSLTFDEMIDGLRAFSIAAYKLPERLEIVDEIPMTLTGKVQRYVLTDRIQKKGSR